MLPHFPSNPAWSSAADMTLMAGGQIGQIARLTALLDAANGDVYAWNDAWNDLAGEQESFAAGEQQDGYRGAAATRYLRAALYRLTGERLLPVGDLKSQTYSSALQSFERGSELLPTPLQRLDIASPDGILPGYLIPANTDRPAPVVIVYNGFDITKEFLFGIAGDAFARRGIHCFVVDTPGTGEPLRLRNIRSRHDYEVPTAAIVDALSELPAVDASRIGLLGVSLGGYYAARGAAFEPRIAACAAWGAQWDWGYRWHQRISGSNGQPPASTAALEWVLGASSAEDALRKVSKFSLVDVLPKLIRPFLIVHGEKDTIVPVEDAHKAFDAASSVDKTLHILRAGEGGVEHINADDPDPARQLIADWFADRLAAPRPPSDMPDHRTR
jgi:alpha-beta hydrolase superfamily lysophospholipase